MLFKTSIPFLQISWKMIAFAVVITTLFFIFAVGMGIRAQMRKPVTGQEGLVGELGKAVDDFSQGKGQVSVHGEIWEAYSDEKIKKDNMVKVVSVENLKIFVNKKT